MKNSRLCLVLVLLFAVALGCAAQEKRKVIIDQDAMGPATTDQQAILVILQAKNVQTLGITVTEQSFDTEKLFKRAYPDA